MTITIYWRLFTFNVCTDKINWKNGTIDATYLKSYIMSEISYYPGYNKISFYKKENVTNIPYSEIYRQFDTYFNNPKIPQNGTCPKTLNISRQTKNECLKQYEYFLAPIYYGNIANNTKNVITDNANNNINDNTNNNNINDNTNNVITDNVNNNITDNANANGNVTDGTNSNNRYCIMGIFILNPVIIYSIWSRITSVGIQTHRIISNSHFSQLSNINLESEPIFINITKHIANLKAHISTHNIQNNNNTLTTLTSQFINRVNILDNKYNMSSTQQPLLLYNIISATQNIKHNNGNDNGNCNGNGNGNNINDNSNGNNTTNSFITKMNTWYVNININININNPIKCSTTEIQDASNSLNNNIIKLSLNINDILLNIKGYFPKLKWHKKQNIITLNTNEKNALLLAKYKQYRPIKIH